ncbi:DUF3137 domain-containing protein [Paenibacillus sp. YIM B09110]|uniref:DUF3137 domain-containing protein n=1 Tax=Paenibacillus sp. YIM B09110 TaxID=3126102 RepID=UPI00301C5E2E
MLPTYEEVSRQLSGTDGWHQLDKKRNFYIKMRSLIWLAGVAISTIGIWLFWLVFIVEPDIPENESEGAIYAVFALIAMMLVGGYVIWLGNRKMHKKYSYHYKKLIVPELVTRLIKEASYSSNIANARYSCDYKINEGIPLAQLQAFPMFKVIKDSHKSKGEDLFVGTLGVTDFQMAEMKIWEVTEDLDSTSKIPLYTGLVFIADFNKDFKGTTVIQSRKGKYTALKVSVGSKIKTMNEAFDRVFRISTTDERTTSDLLPVPMLERLIALSNKFPGKAISICLHDGKLALAIHFVDYFETNGLIPLDAGAIQNTYDEIKSMFEIVELLSLNDRL